ncbi:MAG: capsule biosynthesis protein [Belnapia sp.]|nr:capsule biosynthesis protein [Belnapia sp.]
MARWSFTRHPATVGESYLEHMATAGGFGWRMLGGALACFAHAVVPFWFETTGSATIRALHDRMVVNRHRAPAAGARADAAP